MRETDVARIALTGGPCAGKSTTLARLQQWLSDRNFVTVTVPEGATDLILNGLPPAADWTKPQGFNEHLLRYILERERRFEEAARAIRSDQPRVLLCDRGAVDIAAYTGLEEFARIARKVRRTVGELRDRYEGVIHLVTAADGALAYYTCANNAARSESPEEAIRLDRKTQGVWWGSRHLKVIDNSTDFPGKIERTKQAIARILGIPVPLEIERKYHLKKGAEAAAPADAVRVRIVQHYLPAPSGESRRIRQRTQQGGMSFFYTEKKEVRPGVRIERERRIGQGEYLRLLADQDPERAIVKDRFCFVYERQYFELDVFRGRHEGLAILEVELTEEQDRVVLPGFAADAEEVTARPEFSNAALAERNPAA